MTQLQILREAWPSQIVITIRQPQIFIVNLGVELKWQILRAIQNPQLVRHDFNLARRQLWVFRPRHSRRHFAGDLNHILAAQTVGLLRDRCIFFGPKHNLRQTFAIAQIDKNHAAVIARDVHPAGKRDLLADVGFAKRIAVVRAIHGRPHSGRGDKSRKRLASRERRLLACRGRQLADRFPTRWNILPGAFSAGLPKRTG